MNKNIELIDHLKKTVGVPYNAINYKISSTKFSIDLLKYDNTPFKGCNSTITNGLGNIKITQDNKEVIRFELVMSFTDFKINNQIENTILSISKNVFLSHFKIKRGQVIQYGGNLFEKYKFVALFPTYPMYFSEKFENVLKIPDLNFIWLIPIFKEEVNFIKKIGWKKFENILINEEIDPFLIERTPVSIKNYT